MENCLILLICAVFDLFFPHRQKNQTNINPVENVAAHRSAQNLDITESDMETCSEVVGECDFSNVSSPNKWVIGPLFQSLKSKISSFTEIVITPVKVFSGNSTLPSTVNKHSDDKRSSCGTSNIKRSALGSVFDPRAQSDRETEDTNVTGSAREAPTAVHKCCKKLNMDLSAESPEQTNECPTTGTETSLFVPLQQSPFLSADSVDGLQSAGCVFTSGIPLCFSVAVSASQESKLVIPGAEEELKGKDASQGKPLPGKDAGYRKKVRSKTLVSDLKKVRSDPETTDGQLPVGNSADPSKDETVLSESDGSQKDNSHVVGRSLQGYFSDSVNGRILRSTSDNRPLEAPLDTEPCQAADHRRPKRDLKGDARSQSAVKRKRVKADESVNAQSQELQTRPTRKRQAVSGKLDGAMLTTLNRAGSCRAPALGNSSSRSEESWKSSDQKVKPKKTQRLKTQTCLTAPHLAGDNMDLETTIQIRSAKQTQPERLAKVVCRPQELHRMRKCRESSKNPEKRKLPGHTILCADSGNSSHVLPKELLKVKAADMNTFECILGGRSCKVDLKRSSKRPKKASRSSTPEGSHDTREVNLRTNGFRGSKRNFSVNPVYFAMTPCESSPQFGPLRECYVELGQDVALAEDGRTKASESKAGEPIPASADSVNHSSTTNLLPRPRIENQRRKCSVLHSGKNRAAVANCVSKDDSNLAGRRTLKAEQTRRLLRSFSCPDISTLRSSEVPWNPLHWPHHPRIQSSHQHVRSGPPFPHPAHKSVHRARRHTVCSVELEREVAPLCLRKEVYPSRRSVPVDAQGQYPSASHALSPGTSLSALASCFLSSPLAFLCKKAGGRGASASPGSSASSSFLPFSPTTKPLPGFIKQPDSFGVVMDSR